MTMVSAHRRVPPESFCLRSCWAYYPSQPRLPRRKPRKPCRANVKNCIYEYYTDGTWRLKACSPTKTLPPYTGSGARTVARTDCDNRTYTSWRNHVDVDVIGESDTGEKPYNQSLPDCRVY